MYIIDGLNRKEAFGVSYEQELQNTKVELICRMYFMK